VKNIVLIIITLSLAASLNAKGIYIKVASVDYYKLFNTIYSVEALDYKVRTIEKNDLYNIYAGPFKNVSEANRALGFIKKDVSDKATILILSKGKEYKLTTPSSKKVTYAQKITTQTPKNNKPIKKSTPTQESKLEKKTEATKKSKDSFVALSVSTAMPMVDENDPNFEASNGLSYGLELGYHFTNEWFIVFAYQRTDLDDVLFDSIMTKVDYKFSDIKPISPYMGLILGYSMMSWDSYIETDDKASSFTYGLEVGGEIDIIDSLALDVSYSYMMMDFSTFYNVGNVTNEISYKGLHNLTFSVKYRF